MGLKFLKLHWFKTLEEAYIHRMEENKVNILQTDLVKICFFKTNGKKPILNQIEENMAEILKTLLLY